MVYMLFTVMVYCRVGIKTTNCAAWMSNLGECTCLYLSDLHGCWREMIVYAMSAATSKQS